MAGGQLRAQTSRTELQKAATDVAKKSSPSEQTRKLPVFIATWQRQGYGIDTSYVRMHLNVAKAFYLTNNIDKAIAYCKQVIRFYASESTAFLDPEDCLAAYYRLCYFQNEVGQLKAARETVLSGLRFGQKYPKSEWVASLYSTLAYIYNVEGDFEKAAQIGEQGAQIGQLAGDRESRVNCLFEAAKAYRSLNRVARAHQTIDQAIQIMKTSGVKDRDDASLALYYDLKATLYRRERKFDRVKEYFDKALAINISLKDTTGIANCYVDLGNYYFETRQYSQAERVLTEAARIHPALINRARALNNLGGVYWKQGQFKRGLVAYQQGIETLIPGFAGKTNVRVLPSLDAVRFCPHKDFLLSIIQDKADTWLDSAKATGSQPCFRLASDTYKLADKIIDFMRWDHTGEGSKLFWREKTRSMYERAIETAYRLKGPAQAFYFLEKSRAVMLADKLNELGARQQLTEGQIEEEQLLRRNVAQRQEELAAIPPGDRVAYSKAQTSLLDEQDKLDSFLKRLEVTNPSYYRYRYDSTTVSLARLQTYLKGRNASFVSYFAGDSAFYVLRVSKDNAQLICQKANGYTSDVKAFMALLSASGTINQRPLFARFLALGNGLYRRLLAPLQLPGGSVIVSPDGGFLPFEVLSESADHPAFAINRYAFSYAYSARLLLRESPSRSSLMAGMQGGDFLGIAPVRFAASLKQNTLNGSDGALEAIAGRFGVHTLLTHEGATRGAFQREAPHYRIIQLFTHAVANDADQEPTLYFADSTLKLSELGDGRLPATQLAVLTACKTGVGVDQRGEGVFSLARGFAALGVTSVVSTLWSVEDNVTYELTKLFYQYLDEGYEKDIALQKAKLDLAQSADLLPNQWAGLILIGDTRPLERASPWRWAAGLILVAGGSWVSTRWARRRQKLV
ncbi:hypothetical protein BN8_03512 [Fibrisoma limi BUZ 3]|uniref:CHAT domain-containing protein n=2 Tax=Fibrisoma limi TaxID=663275 RepID=I2GKC5_9BACT|nr:hypothetical protein BN8_03512 [Fibrisoma limi BUZ 3]